MRLSIVHLLSAFVALVAAQTTNGPNAFSVPTPSYLLHAGQSQTFTWTNLEGSTVTLKLRYGANGDLNAGTTIVSGLKNTGTYTWSVPSDTPESNSYAIQIIDEQDASKVNFTPQFVILSPVKVIATSSGSVAVTGLVTAPVASTLSASAASATSKSTVTMSSGTTTMTSVSMGASTGSSSAGPGTTSSSAARMSSSATSSPAATMTVASGNSCSKVNAGGSLLAVALAFAVAF